LVEIPTGDEFMDNIVAFWRPEGPLAAQSEHRFDYSLSWTLSPPGSDSDARILQSRSGREHDRPGTRRYVIDLSGEATGRVPEILAQGAAKITGMSLFDLPEQRGTRITFLLTPQEVDSVDLRLVVREPSGDRRDAVWLHRWTRARDGGV
jgi:glucans biosynthesis protein